MVDPETTDGRRIAELLASEIHGRERGPLGKLAVVDADRDVEATAGGAFAYGIAVVGDTDENIDETADATDASVDDTTDQTDDGTETGDGVDGGRIRLVDVSIHPDGVRIEFRIGVDVAFEAADREGLRVEQTDTDLPCVFVENGAEVKRALRVVRSVTLEFLEEPGKRT